MPRFESSAVEASNLRAVIDSTKCGALCSLYLGERAGVRGKERSKSRACPDTALRPLTTEIRWSWLLGLWIFLGIWSLVLGASAAGRTPWTTGRVVGSPNPPAPYAIERLHPQHTFNHPTDLSFLPGSTRLFVAEQGGKLFSFDTRSNGVKPDLAVDLRQHHKPFDNILGFTFHPNFATNRFIFINYNEPGGRENGAYVSRFTFSSLTPPTIDPASEKVLLRWLSGGHNGCTLAFGNDGMLYISTGDAADPDPPDSKRNTGQDLGDFLACILRIDVDRATGTNAYAVPADNPFLTTPGARPEIWAFGFRNAFRMSFDRPTGDLWVGDVGWELWEMVYRVVRGGNYGWPIHEGPNFNARPEVKPGPGPILPPVFSVSHSEGASITGGFVYRGKRLPKLAGAYLYGDWETGKFWALRQENGRFLSNEELCDTSLKPIAFALDGDGELLILDYNGGIYRFIPNDAPLANQSFPRKLSEAGLFASLAPLTPAAGTVPYRINAPMWNDHATAEWLLAVPGENAIVTAGGVGNIAGATWLFPSNTVLARTLTLEMDAGKSASRRRIETQLLHWDGQAWNPYSYRWNAAQSEADLVGSEGTNDTFVVVDSRAPGGRRETPWRFHSRAECLRCHNAWAGETLTLNWLQLGSPLTPSLSPSAGERVPEGRVRGPSELQRLNELGLLRLKNAPQPLPKPLADPFDVAQPLEARARSWLHVNCSGCHRFGAGGAVAAHLNFDKPLKELRAVDAKPTRGDFGLREARIISSRDPDLSTLLYRISTEGAGRMPHIGSRLVDERGVRLVREWLAALAGRGSAFGAMETNMSTLLTNLAPLMSDTLAAMRLLPVLRSEGAEDFRRVAASVAANSTNAAVRELYQQFLPPESRRRTLGTEIRPETILALQGDVARGREVFHGAAQCSRCHVCKGEGRAFGPELTSLARKYDRAQVLDQMVNPSKVITPEFKTTSVTMRDGTELSGFMVKRTVDEIVLRDETLAEHRLALTQVKESRESLLSAMPEGLLAPMTAQEAADLLEFLFSAPASGR